MKSYHKNNSSANKIEGKFYALQHDEWIRAYRELTHTQRDILYYLRTLDPYGDRQLAINIKDIAAQLDLSRNTVSRALKKLDQGGWIELELICIRARIYTNTSVRSNKPVVQSFSGTSRRASCTTRRASCTTRRASCTTRRALRKPEPAPDKDSDSSKTIKTIKTLSEAERENFLKFAEKKIAQLPKRPALPQKWIEKNFEELWQEFDQAPAQELEEVDMPSSEEIEALKAMKIAGQIRDFYLQPWEGGKTIMVDNYIAVEFWREVLQV